jgi:hypothetical protein
MASKKIAETNDDRVEEFLEKRGLKAIQVKAPASFDIAEIEVQGDLVLLRGWTSAFGKTREITRVYKRVK